MHECAGYPELLPLISSLAIIAAHVEGKQRVAAAILDKRNKVLSIGYNSYVKTHPIQKRYACKVGQNSKEYLHAEIHALIALKNREAAHKMVIIRLGKNDNLLPITPCPICQLAIGKLTNIKEIL